MKAQELKANQVEEDPIEKRKREEAKILADLTARRRSNCACPAASHPLESSFLCRTAAAAHDSFCFSDKFPTFCL